MHSSSDCSAMQEESAYCKYCKLPLTLDSDKSTGYHSSCYQDVVIHNPSSFLLGEFVLPDKVFIEMLLSVINIPYTSHSEDVIVFSDWKRKFEVHFTGNFKSKEILKISYKRADVLQADFPFNNQNATKLVMSNFVKAEFQRIQRTIPILIEINEDWLFLDMIIDELILRNLRTRISPNELEDILKIKDIVHLPFYAISDQIIYFTSFRDEPYPGRSFVRLHLDSNYHIDELMSGLDQSTTERILSIKRSY